MASKAKVALEKSPENGGGAEVFEKFGVKGASASLQGFKGDGVPLRYGDIGDINKQAYKQRYIDERTRENGRE